LFFKFGDMHVVVGEVMKIVEKEITAAFKKYAREASSFTKYLRPHLPKQSKLSQRLASLIRPFLTVLTPLILHSIIRMLDLSSIGKEEGDLLSPGKALPGKSPATSGQTNWRVSILTTLP
jgi:hypothetical protein